MSALPINGRRHAWDNRTNAALPSAAQIRVAGVLSSESSPDLARPVRIAGRALAKRAKCHLETAQAAIARLTVIGAIRSIGGGVRQTHTFELVSEWWERPESDRIMTGASGHIPDRSLTGSPLVTDRSDATNLTGSSPRASDSDPDLRSESGSQNKNPRDSATPPAASPSQTQPTLPYIEATRDRHPTQDAAAAHPDQPRGPIAAQGRHAPLSTGAAPTDPRDHTVTAGVRADLGVPGPQRHDAGDVPAPRAGQGTEAEPAPSKARRVKTATAPIDTRPVTDAWDREWIRRFKAQPCPGGCPNSDALKCRDHRPGYVWARREIEMARSAIKARSPERILRLVAIFHTECDRMNNPTRTLPAFVGRLNTLEALHPVRQVVVPIRPLVTQERRHPTAEEYAESQRYLAEVKAAEAERDRVRAVQARADARQRAIDRYGLSEVEAQEKRQRDTQERHAAAVAAGTAVKIA